MTIDNCCGCNKPWIVAAVFNSGISAPSMQVVIPPYPDIIRGNVRVHSVTPPSPAGAYPAPANPGDRIFGYSLAFTNGMMMVAGSGSSGISCKSIKTGVDNGVPVGGDYFSQAKIGGPMYGAVARYRAGQAAATAIEYVTILTGESIEIVPEPPDAPTMQNSGTRHVAFWAGLKPSDPVPQIFLINQSYTLVL